MSLEKNSNTGRPQQINSASGNTKQNNVFFNVGISDLPRPFKLAYLIFVATCGWYLITYKKKRLNGVKYGKSELCALDSDKTGFEV